jgi:hypothetical protein
MRSFLAASALVCSLVAAAMPARADYYVEYYRDNLFLGLAYHRIGCLSNWYTVQSGQEYDGFTTANYCVAGTSSNSVPGASWFDYQWLSSYYSTAKSRLDTCGGRTNARYGTWGYSERSSTCGYNIATNCNSDCWIRYFSTCVGHTVGTASTCWGYSYP